MKNSLILSTTELLANMTMFRTLEAQTEIPSEDDEIEITTMVTTTQSIVESDEFFNSEESEDITINDLIDIIETTTEMEPLEKKKN